MATIPEGNKIAYQRLLYGKGYALTVPVFSQFSLPASTSVYHRCNGVLKAVNWQQAGLLLLSWIVTIPIASILGDVLMDLVLDAPHFLQGIR
ncbi:hypothetical protein BDFG_01021 [Blastomyces dermatitidis ATCC 26199]|nr:hypothetical protein BDFG_01021 [Blastomyces dermatitidis ATCC 26199]